IHPLAVILAIAAGIVLAGIIGGLIAVPTVAVLNAVGHHLLDDPVDPDGTNSTEDPGDPDPAAAEPPPTGTDEPSSEAGASPERP
ncbi:MAG TPA: AI-2E family transporter, partial [Actinotalea sp.]|nr:AI-2E family transporter [Actinotalea sp.]